MLISSDSNIIEEEYNIEDPINNPSIPTIIISKDFGDIIKEYYKIKKNDENIVLNMKFSGVKDNGKIEIELFFRSDDIKVANFFSEFYDYKEKLGNKLILKPYYKYSKFVNEKYDNSLNKEGPPCVKETKMCATPNNELYIKNGRTIVLENIRQSCIYQELGQDTYWIYMYYFNLNCMNLEYPYFEDECAKISFNETFYDFEGKYSSIIEECMSKLINSNSKIDYDYNLYQKKKIYSVPALYINGVPYRGSWYAHYIFKTICNGFLDDRKICEERNPRSIISKKNKQIIFIIIIIFIISAVLIFSLSCYKKYINKILESTLNETVKDEYMKSLSHYKAFQPKESNNYSSKLEIVN